jgi:hypothetical protein
MNVGQWSFAKCLEIKVDALQLFSIHTIQSWGHCQLFAHIYVEESWRLIQIQGWIHASFVHMCLP